LLAPMFFNAVAVAIWMLFRGVQEDRGPVGSAT